MDEESRVFENNKNPHGYVSWIKKFNRPGSKYLVTCGKQRTHILLDKKLNKEFYTLRRYTEQFKIHVRDVHNGEIE